MRRVFSLLQAVWLALLIAEPAALHACEMHGSGHGTHAATVAAAPDAGVAHDGHEGHHAAARASAPDYAPASGNTASRHCQCLGECCAAAVATLAPTPDIPAVALIAALRSPVDAAESVERRAPDLRLPFANGPPEALTI
jgi:hypothetical protein